MGTLKLLVLTALVAVWLSSCASRQIDLSQSSGTFETYRSGRQKAACFCPIHVNPVVGQYWEMTTKISESDLVIKWQVVKIDGDTALVERYSRFTDPDNWFEYVLAFEVDLTALPGRPNVVRAWIGHPGETPEQVQVMAEPGPAVIDYDTSTESFSGLELCGRKWAGTRTTLTGADWETSTWVAEDGWFSGEVMAEARTYTGKLSAFGEDAKPLLKW